MRTAKGQTAESTPFDNASNGYSATNIQEAIEEVPSHVKETQYLQFQFIGQMNYDQYLYPNADSVSGLLGSARRSGNPSSGYRYEGSAPLVSTSNGTVRKATVAITGIAVSTGSPANAVTTEEFQ